MADFDGPRAMDHSNMNSKWEDSAIRKEKFKIKMDAAERRGRATNDMEVERSGMSYGGQQQIHVDQQQITIKAQYMIRYLADMAFQLSVCHWTRSQRPAWLFVALEQFLKEKGHPIEEFETQ